MNTKIAAHKEIFSIALEIKYLSYLKCMVFCSRKAGGKSFKIIAKYVTACRLT